MQAFVRGVGVAAVVGWTACGLVGCIDFSQASTDPAPESFVDTSIAVENSTEAPVEVAAAEPAPSADEQMEQAFLGTWRLEDHGIRTIEVKADGTASMHIELDFFASLIYGKEMTMELTWFVRDGVLTYSVVSGQPVESVDRVVSDFGRERSYRVLELGEDLIQLQDVKFPGNKYDWTNVGGSADQG